jgi:NAD(P)H-hydrate repair Nnr-like enzyme with NAD(P)H-hydrate epimerase domain
MTDAEYEVAKGRVEKLCKKWHYAAGLGWWMLTYEWCRETRDYTPNSGNKAEAAATHTMWQYRQATIDWNLDVLQNLNEAELEGVVVHEFAHVLIDCLMAHVPAKARDLMEYTTENVARAIKAAYDSGREYDPVTGEY